MVIVTAWLSAAMLLFPLLHALQGLRQAESSGVDCIMPTCCTALLEWLA
jgi:hypothetical protein